MKALLRPSIARRIFFALLLACAFAWFAIYLLGRYLVNKPDTGNFDREMISLADAVRTIAERHPDTKTMPIALSGLEALIRSQARVLRVPDEFMNFHIRDAGGAFVAKSAYAPNVHLGRNDQVGFFYANLGEEVYRVHGSWSADHRYRIELAQSMTSRKNAFNYVMLSKEGLLLPLLVGFPVLLIPMWIAVRAGLRPVHRLSDELASRQPGNLSPLDIRQVDGELVPLVAELNQTMLRLQGLLQRERAFLADAAHEMRTPLALIAAQADTLAIATDHPSRDEAVQRLQAGIDRCSRLVNQLLDLARLDAVTHGQVNAIDLADVVRECLAVHSRVANARDIDLTYEGPDHQVVMMARHPLESVIDNLVSNAARYVQVGGRVLVTLATGSNGDLRLCVSDNGPGIPAADRNSLFERFRRGTGVTSTGSGLGLAIATSAARQLGARIVVGEGLDGRGVSFAVEWHTRIPN